MKVSELITVLNTFDKDSKVIIYNDSTDIIYDICCVDIDERDDIEDSPQIAIFI